MKFLPSAVQKLSSEQTDRHTHRHTHTQTQLKLLPTAYADGKNCTLYFAKSGRCDRLDLLIAKNSNEKLTFCRANKNKSARKFA